MDNNLISREALIADVKRVYCTDCNNYNGVRCRACPTDDALGMIDDASAVDAEPVRHGRWKKSDFIPGMLTCTACGAQRNPKFKIGAGAWHYCPNCGAKMDLKEVEHHEQSIR